MFDTQGRMRIIGVGVMSLWLLATYDTALGRPPAGRGPKFRPGPPAHAPAYGLRSKQVYGMDLTFHAGLGLYVVAGHSDWYYHEGHFYRCYGGVWQISLKGDLWEPVVVDGLPPGLHKKVHGMDLTFAAGPGVYVVAGHSDWYYHEGHFYRLHGSAWQISLNGDLWEPVVVDRLPPGLHNKVNGMDLIFDAGPGLYIVAGHSDWYYHEGHFYRLHGGVWQMSLKGDLWGPVGVDKLPPGLQIKAKAMANANGRSDPGDKGNSAARAAGDNKPAAGPEGSAKDSAKGQAGDAKAGKPAPKPADNGSAKPAGKGKKK
jgi:hypothetical protein